VHVITPVVVSTSRTPSPVITWWQLYWIKDHGTCTGFNIKNSLTCDVYNYNPKITGPVSDCTFYQVGKISDMSHVDVLKIVLLRRRQNLFWKSTFYFCTSLAILFLRLFVERAQTLSDNLTVASSALSFSVFFSFAETYMQSMRCVRSWAWTFFFLFLNFRKSGTTTALIVSNSVSCSLCFDYLGSTTYVGRH